MHLLSVAIGVLDPAKSPLLALRRHCVRFVCGLSRWCSTPAGVHVGELKGKGQGPGPTACLSTVSLEGGAPVDGAAGGDVSSMMSLGFQHEFHKMTKDEISKMEKEEARRQKFCKQCSEFGVFNKFGQVSARR